MDTTSITAIIVGILGVLQGFNMLRTRITEGKIAKLTKEEKEREAKRKIEQDENEVKRDEKLDVKFEKQIMFMRKEREGVYSLLNELSEKVDHTNDRIDEGNRLYSEHVQESSITKDFIKVYRYAYNISIDSWVTDEINEKFKQLLIIWSNSIKEYCIDYLDYKSNKMGILNEFDPEAKMQDLIDNFQRLCDGFSNDYISKVSLGQWLTDIDKKNVHAKSLILALDIKRNGMTTNQFNEKVGTYLINFSKGYIRAIGHWIGLINKNNAIKCENEK